MDPITLAALISAGGTLVSSGVNSGINSNLNKKNREWQEEMYTKYYSPSAQMSQMLSSGINPNLAAQGVSGSPGISMPQASNSNNPVNVDFAGAIDAYTKMRLANAEEKNINANTDNTNADTDNKRIQNKYLDEYWNQNVEKLKAEIVKLGVDASTGEQMLQNLKQKFEQGAELFPLEKDKLKEEANEIRKRIEKMDQEIEESEARIDLMETEKVKNVADARKSNAAAAIDEFIVEKGYAPDDIDTQILRGLVSDDAQEREEANKIIDKYNEFVEGAAEAKGKGAAESTPEGREKIRLEEERDKEIADIDSQIADLKSQLHNAYYSHRKNEINSEIKRLMNQKEKVHRKYRRQIRRVSKGVSGGVSVMGNGVNASS